MQHGSELQVEGSKRDGRGTYGPLRHLLQALFRRALLTFTLVAILLAHPAAAEPVKLVAFGDSLSAGYELPADAAFPARLEAALRDRGHEVEVVNAGVSGDTASAGLARLDWSVPDDVDGVIVQLGANDALRGLDPTATREALEAIVQRLVARDVEVLLAGMLAPPNLGQDYAERFNAIFPDLAGEYDVVLYPFFLDGVVADRALNLEDGMHPNEAGVERIVEGILPAVEELIARIRSEAPA